MSDSLTALEREIVEMVARENWPQFQTDALRVLSRENTGVGRFTYLKDGKNQPLPDGLYSAEGRIVELRGVRNGLSFVVDVSSRRINYLEIVTFGNDQWDGNEDEWKIV